MDVLLDWRSRLCDTRRAQTPNRGPARKVLPLTPKSCRVIAVPLQHLQRVRVEGPVIVPASDPEPSVRGGEVSGAGVELDSVFLKRASPEKVCCTPTAGCHGGILHYGSPANLRKGTPGRNPRMGHHETARTVPCGSPQPQEFPSVLGTHRVQNKV